MRASWLDDEPVVPLPIDPLPSVEDEVPGVEGVVGDDPGVAGVIGDAPGVDIEPPLVEPDPADEPPLCAKAAAERQHPATVKAQKNVLCMAMAFLSASIS